MTLFRHPKTQNERRADQAIQQSDAGEGVDMKGRVRTGKKGAGLPTERDDKVPAARRDRSRGKQTHSCVRKSKERARSDAFYRAILL